MSGYGFYLGAAYGAFCLVLIANSLSLKLQRNRMRKKLQQWLQRQQ